MGGFRINQAWILVVFALTGFAVSCRSTRTIQTAISKKDSLGLSPADSLARMDSIRYMAAIHDSLEKNRISFETFSAKVKVAFQGGDGKRNEFNAAIRLRKDSALWVSINALLGFEAFRALITPDSVLVLNKMDKVYQQRSLSALKEITQVPFSFADIQDLIVGNPLYFGEQQIVSYRQDEDAVTLLTLGDLFKHLLTLDRRTHLIQYSKLDDVDIVRARTASILYGDYETRGELSFSTYRRIYFAEKSKLDIEMKFRQYEFNVPLNFPFTVPKNFKLQ